MPRACVEVDELKLVAKTDRAILVRELDADEEDAEMGENQWWVPLSVIEWRDIYNVDDEGSIEVQEWFAEKEGMV